MGWQLSVKRLVLEGDGAIEKLVLQVIAAAPELSFSISMLHFYNGKM